MASLIILCLGGLILQLNAFKKVNSNIEELASNLEFLADKETPLIIDDIADFQRGVLLLNLAAFLDCQIV